jgi:hypothetical protein
MDIMRGFDKIYVIKLSNMYKVDEIYVIEW